MSGGCRGCAGKSPSRCSFVRLRLTKAGFGGPGSEAGAGQPEMWLFPTLGFR